MIQAQVTVVLVGQLNRLAAHLYEAGYTLARAENAEELGAVLTIVERPCVVVTELDLPGPDGMLLLPTLVQPDCGVIVCTSRSSQVERVSALRMGADDFVEKGISTEEIEARIGAVLRRISAGRPEILKCGEMVIEVRKSRVTVSGKPLELTRSQFAIVTTLARQRGGAMSHEDIAREALGYWDAKTRHVVDIHVSRARLRLKAAGATAPQLVNVRGYGYRLAPAGN